MDPDFTSLGEVSRESKKSSSRGGNNYNIVHVYI